MKKFVLLLLLSGCALSATDTAVKSTQDSLTVLEKSLTVDCKSELVNASLRSIKSQIDTIQTTCQAELSEVRAEKRLWQVLFGATAILILAYIGRKLFL